MIILIMASFTDNSSTNLSAEISRITRKFSWPRYDFDLWLM